MKITETDKTVTIELKGKINAENASGIECEVLDVVKEHPDDEIIFDLQELEYISSSGLRMLLKAQKKHRTPLKIINLSRDLYEIFQVTGFIKMMNVSKAYRNINIDGMELIGTGFTGNVYRADDETVVKVFDPKVSFDLIIAQENIRAKNAFLAGVPTAIPYDIVRVGERFGTVYELLNAKDLVTVIANGKEHTDGYIRMFAQTVKKIHNIQVDPEKFVSLKETSINALSYLSSILSDEEMKIVHEIYENIPERNTFVHGDCHIGNAMLQDGELMFIDLATSGMGHPIFDLVSMYSLFNERADDPKAIAESPILRHFTSDEIINIWNVYIRSYLDTDDTELIRKIERQIDVLSLARRLFVVIAFPGMLTKEALDAMKQKIRAYYEQGLEPITF